MGAKKPLETDEKRLALERVLASRTFQRSDQLKSLLRYLCDAEISGRGELLTEYTVAVEALGRPQNYSTVEDGSARNRVHSLRSRLESYYERENPDDPVRIELPRGSYRPEFEYSSILHGPGEFLVTDITAPVPFWKRPVRLGLGLVLCAIALTLTAFITVVVLRAHTAHVSPVLQEAWGQLLDPAGNPVICIATPVQLPLIQRPEASPNHPTVNSPDLLGWYNGLGRLPAAREIYLGTSTTSPFWGDMAGAFAIAEVLSRAGVNPEILPEAAIELPALRKRNVFLFGRPGYSPTIDRCLQDKPFGIPIPDKERSTVILNAKPKPGEQSEYDPAAESRAQRRETTFGLITVMPSGEGSYFRTVVLSGTLSPGAQAASEFFSSPAELENLKRMFIKEGFKTFPQSYQVIVRSTVFGASALDLQYVTHRAVSGR